MSRFVEECRREWKRLRVPAAVADEMAAELAADLEEAESQGASPEEVLGSGTSDPRSFAESWAAERGVIPPRLTARLPRRSLMLAAIAALTITAAIGAGLVIFASPGASPPVAAIRLPPPPYPTSVSFDRDVQAVVVAQVRAAQAELAHTHAVLVAQPPAELAEAYGSGVDIHTVGSILLIVGIVGIILSLLSLLWLSRARPGYRLR